MIKDMDYWKLITLLLKSTGVTVSLFLIIIVASLPLGMLLTLASRCKFKPLSWLSRAYIFVIRGTPLML
ncbi:MAG: amino acid ABC transporter permease, partial [Clostridiales bacterium]|nr:amino acid ABC transporter permease [Clostridiales bacterium]